MTSHFRTLAVIEYPAHTIPWFAKQNEHTREYSLFQPSDQNSD